MRAKIKVICINNGKIFDSIRGAASQMQIDAGALSRHLSGKRKEVEGYIFTVINGNETTTELNRIIEERIKDTYHITVPITVDIEGGVCDD